jgi:3-oxoacyl-[acyl-carrier protein] reductase
MQLNLKDKKVMITGASKGLGFEIAKAFASEGAIVTICARNEDSLIKAKDALSLVSNKVFAFAMDATKHHTVSKVFQTVSKEMESLDILVNNVGSTEKFADFFNLEENDWMSTYKLNVMSIVHCVKAAYPLLKNSSNPRIINISSLTGLQPGVFSPHYSSSNAAVINLSKHLSNIFAKDKILVNCIVPGPFESDGWQRNIQRVADNKNISFKAAQSKEIEIATKNIPLERMGVPSDIAPMVLLLASDCSSWTSGACTVIDGGKMRGMH